MDKKFHDLLTRYLNGNCNPEEIALINRWYEEIEDKDLELGETEKAFMKARMLKTIQNAQRPPLAKQRFIRNPSLFKVAAAVVALAIVFVWFFQSGKFSEGQNSTQAEGLSNVVTLENPTGSARLYELPDGSTVKLEPSSKIFFSKDVFGDRREVHLTGSAFFDIVSDPARPFYVYSGKIATRVLGTSFFVDAPADAEKVGVKVVTGRVSVFPITSESSSKKDTPSTVKNSTANGVVLSPNQKVEYFIEERHWVVGLVDEPAPVRSIDEKTLSFVFEKATIRDVLTDINERYGIEVVTENEKIYDCTFTGDVSKMSLYDMLDVISNSIGSTYEAKGTQILLSGKGCD